MTAITFPPGSRLGPYEIISLLGAGGMGEVYRARDTRLRREVAIKVLPPGFANDADLLKRFEREARAVSQLNHPNIVVIHDIGHDAGYQYVVMELLEGETLGTRLVSGPLSSRKTLDYAIQIARGLAAAHEKHIVHRDLKPENIFLTDDGRVKILDFGLAHQMSFEAADGSVTAAAARLTKPGMVMGTAAYMSPEQVRGLPTDHRSDLFSFGVVLFEMISGTHPFEAATQVETMTNILNREVPDLSELVPTVPPILRRVVNHCLEKKPEARFQSANDLIFDLENCSELVMGALSGSIGAVPVKRRPRLLSAAIAAAIAVIVLTGGTLWIRNGMHEAKPAFRRMTFRKGIIESARFTADGRTIVYAATWDGKPLRLYLLRTERPESQPLPLPNANLMSISPLGEMAVTLNGKVFEWSLGGTLAQVPLLGGVPREVLEGVSHADWSPDGQLAVWRRGGTGWQLEYPIGRVLLKTEQEQYALGMRLSPDGDQIAVHIVNGNSGEVCVVERDGTKRTLVRTKIYGPGLAWTPDGKEVWYANAPDDATSPAIFAATLDGRSRLVTRMPGWLWIHDISHEGVALMSYNSWQSGMIVPAMDGEEERDLSWLDWSVLADVSGDGKSLLFTEAREGVNDTSTVYMRATDDSPAVGLGEGVALGFSPDGETVLALRIHDESRELVLLPRRAGKTVVLKSDLKVMWGGWLPDGKIILSARTPQGPRMFVQSRDGSNRKPITPPGVFIGLVNTEGGGSGIKPVSPDGKWVFVFDRNSNAWLYPIAGGQPRQAPGVLPRERPAGWSADGQHLYVYRGREIPMKVFEVNVATGERKMVREITLADPAGVHNIDPVIRMPNGEFAYGYLRTMSTLYAAQGLK
jgi:serine/threonine protein kinase/Tol biopolymer transport system component